MTSRPKLTDDLVELDPVVEDECVNLGGEGGVDLVGVLQGKSKVEQPSYKRSS